MDSQILASWFANPLYNVSCAKHLQYFCLILRRGEGIPVLENLNPNLSVLLHMLLSDQVGFCLLCIA